jgi:acetyltransferase-like isoleucine patch superfamily enzyme
MRPDSVKPGDKGRSSRPDLPVEEQTQRGLSGVYERWLRRSPEISHALTMIPVYGVAVLVLGTALACGVQIHTWIERAGEVFFPGMRAWVSGVGIAAGFFGSGFSLLLIVTLIARPLRHWIRPIRGPSHSNRFVPWYLFNALAYLVRYTFLEFITPTPFNLWYFRALGMRVGSKVVINTSHITDAPLITIEEGATIGGSAVLLAHYGMEGYLILAPVRIRKNAVIGLHAKVMAGSDIGEGARILPGSVVMPKTTVPAREIWGGVPAVKIGESA